MALTGAFERFEPDFAGVRQVPAGDQIVIAGRLFVPFEAKRGVGDNDAVEDFAQRHDGRYVGGNLATQRAQHFGDQLGAGRFTTGVVNQLAQGFDFPLFKPLEHALLQGDPVIRPPCARARQQGLYLADRYPFFYPVEDFKRLLDIVIVIQAMAAIGTLWFKQAVATLPGAERRRVYAAKLRKFSDGVGHKVHLIINNTLNNILRIAAG